MNADRFLGPHKDLARELFQGVADLPLVCPHGHVDPSLLSQEGTRFPNPVELLLRPDHYLQRMLTSQGLPVTLFLDVELSSRSVWRTFCEYYHLFWGTPSAIWLDFQLSKVFGIQKELSLQSADEIYDELSETLSAEEFQPRRLFERFNIELLATTDAATDSLYHHRKIQNGGWSGRVIPTFRPDKLIWCHGAPWREELQKLEKLEGMSIENLDDFLEAIRGRRDFFKQLGCKATDHGCLTPYTGSLSGELANEFFNKALSAQISLDESAQLQGHLLMEMAAMSCDDGLVMQLHSGSLRNHNEGLFEHWGPDRGADIPIAVNFTRELKPLLNKFGSEPNFKLIVFTLDESNYSRELAPLAGHYPAMLLGPPWWFHDSLNGMLRYFDQVTETAGVFNTAGFNDDTRAFCSIPARHDLWRRASCRWLSGLVADGIVSVGQAHRLAKELVVDRARSAYRLSSRV